MNYNNEIWKDIPSYEGIYQVSNLGEIRRIYYDKSYCKNKKIKYLKETINKKYAKVKLTINGKSKTYSVHKLVAITFIPNPNNYLEINHKDENTINNCVDNLEWCSKQYNNTYGNRINKMVEKLNKKVNQYDLNDNFIKTWDSIKEAKNYYKLGNHIGECCSGKRKTSGGYKWKYTEEM